MTNETECLHQLGLSKELRGGATSQQEIEEARALLPEAFRDFATGKNCVPNPSGEGEDLVEMAMSGSLKTLFDNQTTSTKPTSAVFISPSFFKVDGKFDLRSLSRLKKLLLFR